MREMPKAPEWDLPDHTIYQYRACRSAYMLLIPVINEGERLVALLSEIGKLGLQDQLDVVIVDGGSTDGSTSESVLRGAGVHALIVKRGVGKLGAQLRCGYAYTLRNGYSGVVTIDGNNKDDPSAVPLFLSALEQGVDFVQGSRFVTGGRAINTPLTRTVAIRCIHAPALRIASGFPWTDTTQGFRAYSRKLLESESVAIFRDVFQEYELLFHLSYIAPRLGFRCCEVPTTRRYPPGKVPTKIHGLSANLKLLRTLWNACTGKYHVKDGE